MWEFELGYRNLSGLTNRTLYDGYIKGTGAAVPYGNIEICIANHSKIPPYGYKNPDDANSGAPLTLAYNSGTGKYEGTFTDSTYINKSYFQVKTANGVEVSYPNSTTMKLAVSQYFPNPIPLTFEHKMPANAAKQAFFILEGTTDSRNQVLCTGAALDPKFYYVNVVTKPRTGTLTIRKTSEDGTAAGFSFNISGNGINRNVTTDGSGQASLSINEGTYTVTEIGTPDRYVEPSSQSVTIQGGGNHTLAFHNAIKKGYVRFVKKCTFYDGYLSGAVYRIYKSDGTYTGQALTSNAAQWVYSPLLSYGDYYLQEYSPPAYYARDTQKYPFSIRDNGASVPVTTYNKPTGDLRPEFITPNSVYRNGTEIVVSYLIHNDSPCEWTPTRPVSVSFKTIFDDGTTINNNAAVVVPRFSYNLVYYKLKINDATALVKLECKVTSPPDMDEPNKTNNTTAVTLPVVKNPESQTPDTKFENTPPYFFKPSETASVPTGGQPVVTNASWQQWEYSGAFVLRTYGAALQPEQTLTPDVNSLSHVFKNGYWYMKSGYGFGFLAKSRLVTQPGCSSPTTSMFNLPQNGNAYLPEFGYELAAGKYRSLRLTAADKLEFEPNPHSMMKDGTPDTRRISFTPIWYPDGNYAVKTYLYDCWTPAGMLSYADTPTPIVIAGNVYQDWYIKHTE